MDMQTIFIQELVRVLFGQLEKSDLFVALAGVDCAFVHREIVSVYRLQFLYELVGLNA